MISTVIFSAGGILLGFVIGWLLYEMLAWLRREVHWVMAVYVLSLILLGAGALLLKAGV